MGVAQETLHSLKKSGKKGAIVKIDLSKGAYDRINWIFLRLLQLTLKGIEVAVNLWVTHLLFVDDILLFSSRSIEDCRCLKKILDIFLKATGLSINGQKSSLTTIGLSRVEVDKIKDYLHFEVKTL